MATDRTLSAVKFTLALTLFNSWVIFEETIVDRLGWWRYLPCYRVGHFCEWDVGAIVIIPLAVHFALRRRDRAAATP